MHAMFIWAQLRSHLVLHVLFFCLLGVLSVVVRVVLRKISASTCCLLNRSALFPSDPPPVQCSGLLHPAPGKMNWYQLFGRCWVVDLASLWLRLSSNISLVSGLSSSKRSCASFMVVSEKEYACVVNWLSLFSPHLPACSGFLPWPFCMYIAQAPHPTCNSQGPPSLLLGFHK